MTKRFFTSDQHIRHSFVSALRLEALLEAGHQGHHPYPRPVTRENMTDAMAEEVARIQAEKWDAVVGPEDTVFVLGDIAINPKRDRAFEWFRERPGKKHLIAGNHDEVHPMHSKALQAQQDWNWHGTFATINSWARLKIEGRTVLMSHFPYNGEGSRTIPDRNVEYRLRDNGFPLLHGHTHALHKAHTSALGSPMFHVGVDAWELGLVPESTIVEWLDYLPPQPQGT
ncbi:metallophosphoesterase [Microbacterium phage PauloDiaboli]|nr:metallophosphoesterase [Microbacterium phage PauloDiaboli]QWY84036.1 metallophosphoesterase [Microbacterium phage A3Wally]